MYLKRVNPGDPLEIPAPAWNLLMDMGQDWVFGKSNVGGGPRYQGSDAGIVSIQNATGSDQARFAVLGIDDTAFTPQSDGSGFPQIVLKGVVPLHRIHNGRFVILAEPVANGQIGRGWIAGGGGVCQVKLAGAADPHGTMDRADIEVMKPGAPGTIGTTGTTSHLVPNAYGAARILWADTPDTTTDPPADVWAIVCLSGMDSRIGRVSVTVADSITGDETGTEYDGVDRIEFYGSTLQTMGGTDASGDRVAQIYLDANLLGIYDSDFLDGFDDPSGIEVQAKGHIYKEGNIDKIKFKHAMPGVEQMSATCLYIDSYSDGSGGTSYDLAPYTVHTDKFGHVRDWTQGYTTTINVPASSGSGVTSVTDDGYVIGSISGSNLALSHDDGLQSSGFQDLVHAGTGLVATNAGHWEADVKSHYAGGEPGVIAIDSATMTEIDHGEYAYNHSVMSVSDDGYVHGAITGSNLALSHDDGLQSNATQDLIQAGNGLVLDEAGDWEADAKSHYAGGTPGKLSHGSPGSMSGGSSYAPAAITMTGEQVSITVYDLTYDGGGHITGSTTDTSVSFGVPSDWVSSVTDDGYVHGSISSHVLTLSHDDGLQSSASQDLIQAGNGLVLDEAGDWEADAKSHYAGGAPGKLSHGSAGSMAGGSSYELVSMSMTGEQVSITSYYLTYDGGGHVTGTQQDTSISFGSPADWVSSASGDAYITLTITNHALSASLDTSEIWTTSDFSQSDVDNWQTAYDWVNTNGGLVDDWNAVYNDWNTNGTNWDAAYDWTSTYGDTVVSVTDTFTSLNIGSSDVSNWNDASTWVSDNGSNVDTWDNAATWVADNSANVMFSGDNVSLLNNDAGYLVSSDLANYATTADVGTATSDMATQTWVNSQGFIGTAGLSAYATTADLGTATSDMATQTWVNGQGFATTASLSGYATTSDIGTAVSGLASTSYVDSAIAGITDDDSGLATTTYVDGENDDQNVIIDGHTSDIATINGSLSTAQSNISDLQSRVAALEAALAGISDFSCP